MTAKSGNPTFPFFWRNFLVHAVEGGLYMGGLAFVAVETILPPLANLLGAPIWLVSLMPVMLMLGFCTPPLLTAHHVERLVFLKPIIVITGGLQRLPYLFAGLILFYYNPERQTLALATVALTPFISGVVGGLASTAWQSLVANTVPKNRRASLFAVRRYPGAISRPTRIRHSASDRFRIPRSFVFCFHLGEGMGATTSSAPASPDTQAKLWLRNRYTFKRSFFLALSACPGPDERHLYHGPFSGHTYS
ncbi:MAG: hypothetical protein LC725_01975 [Lentisphaerae bacterium]|nr:hypothetical protein [Lentisphaerota bacterium]